MSYLVNAAHIRDDLLTWQEKSRWNFNRGKPLEGLTKITASQVGLSYVGNISETTENTDGVTTER